MIKDEFSKAFSDFNTKMAEIEISSSTESIIEATSTATSSEENILITPESVNEEIN